MTDIEKNKEIIEPVVTTESEAKVKTTNEMISFVELPSNGFGYGGKIPAKLQVRPIKVADEKLILTSNANNQLNTINEVLKRCIINDIEPKDLFESDRLYLIYILRSISYSDLYHLQSQCGCGCKNEIAVEITKLDVIKVESEDQLTKLVELPVSKRKVTVKSITAGEYDSLQNRIKSGKGDSYVDEICTRVKSIEGEDQSYPVFKRVINEFIGRDSSALRTAINSLIFGLTGSVTSDCKSCGEELNFDLTFSPEFFRPREG